MNKLTVGQKLWFVSNHRGFRDQREVTVLRVGRKWADIGRRLRIDVESLIVDGGDYSSPGRCYTSKEEYERIRNRALAWNKFTRDIHNKNIPDSVTTEDIFEAARLLGIDIEK